MRIIGGKFKGRRFTPPSNITARPTTDFAKESLFNLIGNEMDIEGITALDLFSGTGSISYELASRDALHITAIEFSERHISYIHKMCKELKVDNIRTMRQDVFRFLQNSSTSYDLIFADPPYQLENISVIPDMVFDKNRLNEDGLLIVEHGSKTDFSEHKNFVSHRNYGNVHFSFFRNKGE
ncbi:MAG: 16S rRNA (guanine(966)-N(2))-methyltransferase RsmD [bacterium]